jgi:DNA-binding LytR/AlgR family response regulator
MIKAIAIDDEPLALKVLDALCKANEQIELVKTFTSIKSAELFVSKNDLQLIFMDIEMPNTNGIELVKIWPKKHMIIFTTAYPQYAVEGFNLNAIDYLLKPIPQERFNQAVDKAVKEIETNNLLKKQTPQYLSIKTAFSITKINIADIIYIEGLDDYQKIHLTDKKFVIARSTLKTLQEELADKNFIRVHKSYIVPIDKIKSIKNKHVFLDYINLPIGSIYENLLWQAFNLPLA